MAAPMTDDPEASERELAQELIGDMAELINNTRPVMFLCGGLLAALAVSIAVEAAFAPSPFPTGVAGIAGGLLLAALMLCWLTAVTLLTLAGRPILGIVSDHRWKAGAPLDPRARWLNLPPVTATRDEWVWVRAHMLIAAARIRMSRVQAALLWTLATTALFLAWTAVTLLAR